MKPAVQSRKPVQAQTLVIFAIGIGVMALLCGFAIDSGLLYLAKARLSRAVDGAALSAVGNFNEISPSTDPTGALNRDAVSTIMRNFAIANYGDLSSISTSPTGGTPSGGAQSTYVTTSGANAYQYTYIYADPSPITGGADSNANPPYRRYVEVILQTGAGGQITSGQCSARCPAHTYFMGVIPAFSDLKVSSSAVATRNPRLIMVVVDRSASMLASGGGAFDLPEAITTFLNFFDTSSDYVGLVSFGSSARLEMPLTTNFLEAGTNDLYDSYQIDNDGDAIPGVDPEEYTNYNNFTTNDVRRMKFGGQTAADEGIRLAVEQLMENPGYSNPNVVKYIVVFTDGAWNTVRTMVAAPGYTNVYTYPNTSKSTNPTMVVNRFYPASIGDTAQYSFPGVPYAALPMPFLSPWPDYSNAVTYGPAYNSPNGFDAQDHVNDQWQSADDVNEPLGTPKPIIGGSRTPVLPNTTNSAGLYNGFVASIGGTDYYTSSVNVWLPPGSVDYTYTNGVATPIKTVVSDYTNPSLTTNIDLVVNESNVLVVPGYICEGIISDSLDLPYPDNAASSPPGTTYPRYCNDNFNIPFMWPDETNAETTVAGFDTFEYGGQVSGSTERALMFRNYVNLLTGYYVIRPDDPMGSSVEPLTGATRPLYGNGPYYPGAGFYWPFGDANGGAVGIDGGASFALRNATSSSDPTDQGYDRFISYSINMLSTNAEPEYAGELFYEGTGGTNVFSGTSAVSTQITSSSSWQNGAPSFVNAFSSLMTNETSHFPTNIGGAIWRPMAFNGSNANLVNQNYVANTHDAGLASEVTPGGSATGGYVQDGTGRVFKNAMAYSGRPTHYFDFSKSSWEPIPDNHIGYLALGLGNWKALEYAWHARAAGVTIYTIGYGHDVDSSECQLLANVANATNVVVPDNTNLFPNAYLSTQPIGQQFYATTNTDISNDFYQIATTINGALTQ